MKFGRYLRDSLIPEWRKAYIDYRGLKKVIKVIQEQEQLTPGSSKSTARSPQDERSDAIAMSSFSPGGSGTTSRTKPGSPPRLVPRTSGVSESVQTDGTLRDIGEFGGAGPAEDTVPEPANDLKGQDKQFPPSVNRSREPLSRRSSRSSRASGKSYARSTKSIFKGSGSRKGRSSRARTPLEPANLEELLRTLTPSEKLFFERLDEELKKVSTFYNEREKEAKDRAEVLMGQLRELAEHREAYKAAFPDTSGPWPGHMVEAFNKHATPQVHFHRRRGFPAEGISIGERDEFDPHEYQQSKKKIKKALQEYYRGLELLDNYRILNLTGFRKALKKFEKVTGILFAQRLYMNEKIEPCKFASTETLKGLRQDMEIVYADRFAKGDRKRARDRLRAEVTPKTHHFSTFRAGTYIGLGIPALVFGIVRSFDPYVRAQVPEWATLLNIYGVLFILPVFAFLLGLNLCAWTHARINWVFIFDLDVRSVLDYRQFFELPAFLFMALCYAFFLSYYYVDSPKIAPHTWPLAWIVFSLVVLFNPLPISRQRSRWWFLVMFGRLLVSGATRVEFADFWLGDQFCSFAYTFGNLYVFGCAYNNDWNSVSALCGTANTWVAAFLSALPYAVRLAQCIRRWADSGLKIHLLNAGKYLSMIVVYIVYYHWRHLGSGRDASFVLYCFFATIGAIYTCSWDLLMDWSLMRPKAPYKFLREDLVYGKDYVPAYYFAIISNIILRFTWVFYIPTDGLSLTIRAWIFAVLEALRRWQWNFYRVENEHIGNADRYRVTKEIPLPYTMRPDVDDDGDDSEQEAPRSLASATSRRSGNRSLARSSSFNGRKGLEDGTRVRGEASRQAQEED